MWTIFGRPSPNGVKKDWVLRPHNSLLANIDNMAPAAKEKEIAQKKEETKSKDETKKEEEIELVREYCSRCGFFSVGLQNREILGLPMTHQEFSLKIETPFY